MTDGAILVTGIGSVSAFGPCAGPIRCDVPRLSPITRWPTPGPRRARLVPAFRPTDVVPGLRTRRIDRLAVWALVSAGLALKDAGLEAGPEDGDRAAVIVGSAFGCLDTTEEFMGSISRNGHAMADPILFPETLSNLPASHVARHFKMRGPNVTLACGGLSGSAALAEAVADLRTGEADLAIVMAGDVLSRALFEWYEASGLLAPACLDDAAENQTGFDFGTENQTRFDFHTSKIKPGLIIPGEGLGAVVLETSEHAARRDAGARAYARFEAIDRAPDPPPVIDRSLHTGEFWSTSIVHIALGLGRTVEDRLTIQERDWHQALSSTITLAVGGEFR